MKYLQILIYISQFQLYSAYLAKKTQLIHLLVRVIHRIQRNTNTFSAIPIRFGILLTSPARLSLPITKNFFGIPPQFFFMMTSNGCWTPLEEKRIYELPQSLSKNGKEQKIRLLKNLLSTTKNIKS